MPQGYSFYRFWVIKGKLTGEGKITPTQKKANSCKTYVVKSWHFVEVYRHDGEIWSITFYFHKFHDQLNFLKIFSRIYFSRVLFSWKKDKKSQIARVCAICLLTVKKPLKSFKFKECV